MANIIEFNEFTSTANGTAGEQRCWLCQKGVTIRALFCHHCGTIQPVRAIDHFSRLGLERRVDVDLEHLDRQYEALKRTLDPSRFTIRGAGERGHAAKQNDALDASYETLRDPVRRGRYWLTLHEKTFEAATSVQPMIAELMVELADAAAPAHCDRVAHKVALAMEDGIMGLLQCLRSQNWQKANSTLIELDSLESILNNTRLRRSELMPTSGGHEGLASVK